MSRARGYPTKKRYHAPETDQWSRSAENRKRGKEKSRLSQRAQKSASKIYPAQDVYRVYLTRTLTPRKHPRRQDGPRATL